MAILTLHSQSTYHDGSYWGTSYIVAGEDDMIQDQSASAMRFALPVDFSGSLTIHSAKLQLRAQPVSGPMGGNIQCRLRILADATQVLPRPWPDADLLTAAGGTEQATIGHGVSSDVNIPASWSSPEIDLTDVFEEAWNAGRLDGGFVVVLFQSVSHDPMSVIIAEGLGSANEPAIELIWSHDGPPLNVVVESARVLENGTQLLVEFDQEVDLLAPSGSLSMTLDASGGAVTVEYHSMPDASSILFTLSRPILPEEMLTLDYDGEGIGAIISDGRPLEDFTDFVVDNESEYEPPVVALPVDVSQGIEVETAAVAVDYQASAVDVALTAECEPVTSSVTFAAVPADVSQGVFIESTAVSIAFQSAPIDVSMEPAVDVATTAIGYSAVPVDAVVAVEVESPAAAVSYLASPADADQPASTEVATAGVSYSALPVDAVLLAEAESPSVTIEQSASLVDASLQAEVEPAEVSISYLAAPVDVSVVVAADVAVVATGQLLSPVDVVQATEVESAAASIAYHASPVDVSVPVAVEAAAAFAGQRASAADLSLSAECETAAVSIAYQAAPIDAVLSIEIEAAVVTAAAVQDSLPTDVAIEPAVEVATVTVAFASAPVDVSIVPIVFIDHPLPPGSGYLPIKVGVVGNSYLILKV